MVVRNENKIGLVGGKQVKELVSVKYDKIGHKNVLTENVKRFNPCMVRWKNGLCK